MNPRQAILGYTSGHFENVSGLQWIQPKSGDYNYERSINRDLYGNEPSLSNNTSMAD